MNAIFTAVKLHSLCIIYVSILVTLSIVSLSNKHAFSQTIEMVELTPTPSATLQPSSLTGSIYPRKNEDDVFIPLYDITLKNEGEDVAQNIVLNLYPTEGTSLYHISDASAEWECSPATWDSNGQCSLSVGELKAGQIFTVTASLKWSIRPAIQASDQRCLIDKREIEEPIVTATANDMSILTLTPSGQIAWDYIAQNVCPALEPDIITGTIRLANTNQPISGPFKYTIELQRQQEYITGRTLYFDDAAYTLDQEQSDEGWVLDESNQVPNQGERWRFDIAYVDQSETMTISLAVNPVVPNIEVETEEDAYIELAEPNVVMDGPVFDVNSISLTKSGQTVTCRCYEVTTDGSAPVSPTPTPTPTPTPVVPVITAGDYTVAPSGMVNVMLDAANFDSVGSINIELRYDPNILQVMSCSKNLDKTFDFGICNSQYLSDTIRFNGIALTGISDNVNLAEITFEAIGQIGDMSAIELEVVTVTDNNGQMLTADSINGQVVILDQPMGDVNCDGKSNPVDGLFILQYDVALREGSETCVPPQRDARTLYETACDINGDGQCDAVDALVILQCDVGLWNRFC